MIDINEIKQIPDKIEFKKLEKRANCLLCGMNTITGVNGKHCCEPCFDKFGSKRVYQRIQEKLRKNGN